MEQAAGAVIGKVIPGFKTFDELLDWLKRNDAISPAMLKDIKDNVDAGKNDAPSGSITVNKAINDKLNLNDLNGDFEFLAKVDGSHIYIRETMVIMANKLLSKSLMIVRG
ncbi:hypothetical protein [Pseudoalteromonas piscicida]|nr:hypothetical protein [Pseudoalteromonas piscicida]